MSNPEPGVRCGFSFVPYLDVTVSRCLEQRRRIPDLVPAVDFHSCHSAIRSYRSTARAKIDGRHQVLYLSFSLETTSIPTSRNMAQAKVPNPEPGAHHRWGMVISVESSSLIILGNCWLFLSHSAPSCTFVPKGIVIIQSIHRPRHSSCLLSCSRLVS